MLDVSLHSNLAIIHVSEMIILLYSVPITVVLTLKIGHFSRVLLSIELLGLLIPVQSLVSLVLIWALRG